MRVSPLALLLALFFSSGAGASQLETVRIELKKQGIEFETSGVWSGYKDRLTIPYLLVEKRAGDFRANVSVSPIGRTPREIPSEDLEKTQSEYRLGREDYLRRRGGEALRFLSSEHRKRDPGTRVHAFGYEYRIGGRSYHEQSHYLFCSSGEVWLIKGVSSLEANSRSRLQRTLESFRCAGVR